MKSMIVLIALFSASAHAQVTNDKPAVVRVNPKFLYMNCELANIYGNTNDSWGLTINGLKAAFWDNDKYSVGTYVGATGDLNFGETNARYGDGRYFNYKGPRGDSWKFVIGPTFSMENYKPRHGTFIYGRLKVPGSMKEQIMECKFITKKEAAEVFEYAND